MSIPAFLTKLIKNIGDKLGQRVRRRFMIIWDKESIFVDFEESLVYIGSNGIMVSEVFFNYSSMHCPSL